MNESIRKCRLVYNFYFFIDKSFFHFSTFICQNGIEYENRFMCLCMNIITIIDILKLTEHVKINTRMVMERVQKLGKTHLRRQKE